MSIEMKFIKVPTSRREAFEQMVAKINRKAVKYGLAPLRVNPFNITYETITLRNGKKVDIEIQEYAVVNPLPKINGWTLAAHYFDKEGDGELTFRRVNDNVSLDHLETLDVRNCDHCHTRRARKSGFVLSNDETGELIQLGNSCVKDYLGSTNSKIFEKWFGLFSDLGNWWNPEEPGVIKYDYQVRVRDVLAVALADARDRGYVSNAKAEERGIISTGSVVCGELVDTSARFISQETLEKAYDEVPFILNHFQKIRAAGEHKANDWAMNVDTLIQKEHVATRNINMLASAIARYVRETATKDERVSNFVGDLGERREFELTVENKWDNSNDYYAQYFSILYFCRDENGNKVTIKSSRRLDGVTVGEKVTVVGTIKSHEDNKKHGKSTLINRVKIVEETVA